MSRIRSCGQRRPARPSAEVDGDRNDFEAARGEHHHRMRPPPQGEAARYSVCPGKAKAGAIEHRLGDRVGDDGGCLAGRTRLTARSIDCIIAGAAAGSGRPAVTGRATGIGSTGSSSAKRSQQRRCRRSCDRHRRPRASARSASTAGSPTSTNGGIASASAPTRLASVMSGPIPAGSPSVSARGSSARPCASASTKRRASGIR